MKTKQALLSMAAFLCAPFLVQSQTPATMLPGNNVVAGNGIQVTHDGFGNITITNVGASSGSTLLKVNGTNNGSQLTLNLACTGTVTCTDNGNGTVTVAGSSSSGSSISTVVANSLPAGSTPTASISGSTLTLGIPAGAAGATGAAGVSPTVTVNSVAALAAGAAPTVSVDPSSTASLIKLNFGLPPGAAGAQGPIGLTGATGPQGAQGLQGAAGLQGPTGSDGAQGSAGPTGAQGATGAAGSAASVAIGTTTTVANGTPAAVSNAGTSSAAILNFTIPAGPQGPTGAAGPQGAAGSSVPSGQSTRSVVIAASNSPASSYADVVATGTSDQTTINSAISSYCGNSVTGVPGCTVLLMPGVYNLSGSVIIDHDDVTLKGFNDPMWGGYVGSYYPPNGTISGTMSLGNSQLRASATGFPLIQINHNCPSDCGTGSDTTRHRGITITQLDLEGSGTSGGTTYGIFDSVGDDFTHIAKNVIQRVNMPISIASDSGLIEDNSIQNNYAGAITIQAGSVNVGIERNLIWDNGGPCVTGTLTGAVITANRCGDSYGGVIATGGSNFTMTGNGLHGIAGAFVNLGTSQGSTVTTNVFDNSNAALLFTANTVDAAQNDGIVCSSGANGNVIANNSIGTSFPMTGYAINALNCSNSSISGNTVLGGWNTNGTPINAPATGVAPSYNPTSFTAETGSVQVASAALMGDYNAATLGLANGATVSTWTDTSGWGNNETGHGTPLYETSSLLGSGLAAVRLNASSIYFTCSLCYVSSGNTSGVSNGQVWNSGRSMFAVFNYTTAPTTGNVASLVNANKSASTAVYINLSNQVCASNGGTAFCSTATLTVGSNYVVEVSASNAGTSSRISINGTLATGTVSNLPNKNGYNIGGNGTTAYEAQIDLGRLLNYYGQLSSADAATIAASLASTYSITITSGSANW